jgi:hypothetical protein
MHHEQMFPPLCNLHGTVSNNVKSRLMIGNLVITDLVVYDINITKKVEKLKTVLHGHIFHGVPSKREIL